MTIHIIACDGRNPAFPFGFGCLHCGGSEKLPGSLPLDVYLGIAKAFEEKHMGCRPSYTKEEA